MGSPRFARLSASTASPRLASSLAHPSLGPPAYSLRGLHVASRPARSCIAIPLRRPSLPAQVGGRGRDHEGAGARLGRQLPQAPLRLVAGANPAEADPVPPALAG